MTALNPDSRVYRAGHTGLVGSAILRRLDREGFKLTREEGVALVRQFDGEMPSRYFAEVMDHIGMTTDEFISLCDGARSPHLWEQRNGAWTLRHTVA